MFTHSSLPAAVVALPFGWAALALQEGRLTALSLGKSEQQAWNDLINTVGACQLHATALEVARRLVEGNIQDITLELAGTPFQKRVWQALQTIPSGRTASYTDLAMLIEQPQAVRAVAGACASNRIAWLVPCHRVIRHDGALSGYRWGVEIKHALLQHEAMSLQD